MTNTCINVGFNTTEMDQGNQNYLSTGLGSEEMDIRGRVMEATFLGIGA